MGKLRLPELRFDMVLGNYSDGRTPASYASQRASHGTPHLVCAYSPDNIEYAFGKSAANLAATRIYASRPRMTQSTIHLT